jgi:quercetin dioxygenase-like cupin family protein
MCRERKIPRPDAGTGSTADERSGETTSRFDEATLRSLDPYGGLDNPVLGHRYRLLRRDADDAGEFFHSEFRFDADATRFDAHVHPEQDETIGVLSGEFEVAVGDDRRTLGPGEEFTLPAGVPHDHGNVPGVETRVLHEIRPPMDFEAGLRMFCALTQAGKTNARGQHPLAAAVFLDRHPRQLHPTRPSIRVRTLLFRLLVPLGRVRGYDAEWVTRVRVSPPVAAAPLRGHSLVCGID